MDEEEYKRACKYVWWLLTRKSVHSEELASLLHKKDFSEKVTTQVLQKFQDMGYLNDESWAERFVEKLAQQGKSSHEIVAKCRLKRVNVKHILPHLQGKNQAALSILVKKRYSCLLDPKSPLDKRKKALAALGRRGFSYQEVQGLVQRLLLDE